MTTSKNWMPGVATNWGMGVTDHHQPQAKGENGMEDWAAKARAWATAKAAQEAAIVQVQAQYQQQQQQQAQVQAQQVQQEHVGGYYGNEWQHHHHHQGQAQGQGQGGFSRHGEQQIRSSYGGHEAPPTSYSQDWEAWNSRPWQEGPPHPLSHSHPQATGPDQQQPAQQHQQQQAFHDYPPPHPPLQPQSLPQEPAAGPGYNHDVHMAFSQDSSTYPHELPASAYDMDTSSNFAHDAPAPSYAQDSASTSYKQSSTGPVPVISSGYSQDASSSFGQESGAAVPPGTELHDHQQHPVMPHAPVLPQHQQLAPSPTQAQPPLHSQPSQQQPPPPVAMPLQQQAQQQQQFPYPYPPMPTYDLQPHQQFDFQQAAHAEYPQQPPPQFMPAVSSIGIDGPEVGYGGPPPMQGWPPMGAPGMSFPSSVGINIPGGPGGPQFEHLHHHQQAHGLQPPHVFVRPSGPNFRPSGPPLTAPFAFGPNSSIGSISGVGMVPMFPGDVNGNITPLDRPKKAAVPSWLREELIKKKAAAVSGNSVTLSTPEEVLGNGAGNPSVNRKLEHVKSDSSGASDPEDDEDEDEAEAARTAAINYEIKRILTEILLKVTQDIFDEIAQEVVDEDDEGLSEGVGSKISEITRQVTVQSSSPPSPPPAPGPTAPARAVVAVSKTSQPSSEDDTGSLSSGAPTGNLLGLATYASDEEDGERSSLPVAALSKRSGPETNGEPKERNHRWKADEKTGDHIRGSDTKDRSSRKIGRMEARAENKRIKRPLDENHDGPSPRRSRLSRSVEQSAEAGVAGAKEETASQNHTEDTSQEQQAASKSVRGGPFEALQSGEHDIETKTGHRSRANHASIKERDSTQSKQESKRETKSKDTSNRNAEKVAAGHGPDSVRKEKVPKDGDTVRRDHENTVRRDHEHADRRETLRDHDSAHLRKRDAHRDHEKDYAKDSEKIPERERKTDHNVEIDRYKERSKGQNTRSEREKRRSDKEMDSKSRDRERDGRERRDSRDSRESRRRRRSSSTGSRGRSRSTNH